MNVPVVRCRHEPWAGYSVKWSPFFPDRLAVASSANFGLVGNGRLQLMSLGVANQGPAPGPTPTLNVDKFFDTQDGLYDLAWSEVHENQLVTGSGDGSIKLWDVSLNEFPIRNWHEHRREVFNVDWSNLRKDTFASSSWDHTIKLWHPERPQSLKTIPAHTGCVYAANFAPHEPDTIASCSSDGLLKIWDLKAPTAQGVPTPGGGGGGEATAQAALTIPAHPTEVLSLAWNYYFPHLVATSSVDRTIKLHDLRMASSSPAANSVTSKSTVTTLLGHEFAVRKIAFSPHSGSLLASASYDMTARIWEIDPVSLSGPPNDPNRPNQQPLQYGPGGVGSTPGTLRQIYDGHSEFVVGLAWSFFHQGSLATSSWDCGTHVIKV